MPFKKKKKAKTHRLLKAGYLRLFITLFVIPTLLVCVWVIFLETPYSGTQPDAAFVEKTKWLTQHTECGLGPKPQIESTSTTPSIEAVSEKPEIKDSKNEVTITVWDQNAWSMLMSLRPQQRLVDLGHAVKNRHIVTMQELFTSQSLNIDQYAAHPYFVYPGLGNTVLKRTGLGILSKFQVNKINHHLYTTATHWDSIANKGIFYSEIEHPVLGLIDVFTTHLQASYGPLSYNEIRTKQVDELIEFINRYPDDRLKIITGDFNLAPINPLYEKIVTSLGLLDLSKTLHPETSFVTYPGSKKQLDYIFIKPPTNWQPNWAKSEMEAIDLGISDHLSLCAKIVLDKDVSVH